MTLFLFLLLSAPLLGSSEVDRITEIVSDTFDSSRGFKVIADEDPRSLELHLKRLSETQTNCIYLNGVNVPSFNRCYGPKFAKLESEYVSLYKLLRQDFEKQLSLDFFDVCDIDSTPCHQLKEQLQLAMARDVDPHNHIEMVKDSLTHPEAIVQERFDSVMRKLKIEYAILENSRNVIASSFMKTINKIRAYMKSTDMPVSHKLRKYDPTKFYASMGLTYFVVSKSQSLEQGTFSEEALDEPDIDVPTEVVFDHGNPFYDELLNNSNARSEIDYYFANKLVSKEEVDLGLMPKDLLESMREILRKKKQQLL